MKKVCCLVVCFSLLLCCMPVSSAHENVMRSDVQAVAMGEKLPLIVVRGIDFNALRLNPGTESESPAINPFVGKEIITVIKNTLVASLKCRDEYAGIDVLLDYFRRIFGNLACDKYGNSVKNVSVPSYPLSVDNYPEILNSTYTRNEMGIVLSSVERLGGDYTYYFNYDWRLNPLDYADDIAQMVSTAKSESGCEKVNIVSASLGGIQTVAYLTKYGSENIDKCIFLSSAFCGTYVASDLFSEKVNVDSGLLYSFLIKNIGTNAGLRFGLKCLKYAGVFSLAAKLANSFINKNRDYIFDNFVREVFGYMPGLWAVVMPEEYETATQYMFGECRDENAEFLALTGRLRDMNSGSAAMLKNARENKLKIYVAAGYNAPLIPVYSRATENGDGTLETAPMLGDAVVAPFGKTLGDDYVPSIPGKLSPDKVVDLSTCLFPQNTWAIRDGDHVACSCGTASSDFLFWLLAYDGYADVTTNPSYPQFMTDDDKLWDGV